MRNPLRTPYDRRRAARPEERRGRRQAARQEPRLSRTAEHPPEPDQREGLLHQPDAALEAGRDQAEAPEPGAGTSAPAGEAAAAGWVRQGLVTPIQSRALEQLVDPSRPLDLATLQGLVEAGVITRSQAAQLQRAQGLGPSAPGEPPAGEPALRLSRVSLDARPLGLVLAGLGLVALVWAAAVLGRDAFGGSARVPGAALLDAFRLVACLLVVIGGRRMWRGLESGKPVVLVGLVLLGLSTLLLTLRQVGHPLALLLVLAWTVVYYLTAASRLRPVPPSDR